MKRIIKITLFMVVAILMLFPANKVMAQLFPPESCTAGPYTITLDPSAPLTVTSTADPNFTAYPCYSSTGGPCRFPYYVYPYRISSTSNISRIVELLPVCEFPIYVLATNPQNGQTQLPGVPDPSLKWPTGIYDSYVLTWTSNPSSGKFWVATNTSGLDINALALKAGNSIYYCGIAGPGCGLPTGIPISRTTCVTIENENVCFDFGADGCPIKIYNGTTGVVYEPDPPDPNIDLSDCGDIFGTQNPNCRMCIRRVDQPGSGQCSNCVVAGRVTRIPTNCCNDALPCPRTKPNCISGQCQ